MEILILFFIWILVLYIIKLNKEIYQFKQKLNAHKSIYIPTISEMIRENVWYLQLLRSVKNKVNERKQINKQIEHQILTSRKLNINRLAALPDDLE